MIKNFLLRTLLIVSISIISFHSVQAQFATTGVGRYKEQIFWLNWDKSTLNTGLTSWPTSYGSPNGRLDGAQLVLGEYIWTISPEKIRVVGDITNLSSNPIASANINASPSQGGTGDYSTGFLNMYGGVAGSIGIKNQINGSLVQITLSLSLQIYNGAEWVTISSPGIIVADVESLTVTNSESIQGTVTNAGNVWELIDYNTGRLTSSTSTYSIDITSNGTNRTFKAYNTTNNSSTGDKQESVVMFARGARTIDMSMKGNGLQIAAFGFVMPFDYGDLPQSYGEAAHYLPLFDSNGQSSVLPVGTYNPKTATILNYTSRAPIKLGANADADHGFNFTVNADGDDLSGIDDEDGISDATLESISIKTTSINVLASNTGGQAAYLHAWIDQDQSGIFENSEKLVITNNEIPTGSENVTRALTLPAGLKAGQYYSLRVRIGSGTTHQNNLLAALDGEVEDYRIYIKGYSIQGAVVHDTDGLVNGVATTTLGAPDGNTIYAYLLGADGKIIAVTNVDPVTGGYLFSDINIGDYQVKVSSNVFEEGQTVDNTLYDLPEGWSNSVQRNADQTLSTTNYATVSLVSSDNLDEPKKVVHGINKRPIAQDALYTLVEQPGSGQLLPLDNTIEVVEGGNLGMIDYEDADGIKEELTVTITSLPFTDGDNTPSNTPELLYDGEPVIEGEEIPNFDPSLLELRVKGIGYTKVSFKFTVTDAAGVTSNESTYSVQWNSALPVTLIALEAVNAENRVVLKWTTASEIDSKEFVIERATKSGWVSLGAINAQVESNKISHYDFVDETPLVGENLYRLKMIDLDGSFSYSKIIAAVSDVQLRIYPNPVQDFLHINAVYTDTNKVTIFNTAGAAIYTSDDSRNVIDIRHLSEGVYVLKIEGTNGALTIHRFMIVR